MALEQHAIPSQVTSYEFRLVGDMTIKQFGWLAGGILLAILAYSLPLPSFIRWSMVLMLAPSGAIIAFIPIDGRGMDRWIIAFFKAIYSPTEFVWHQEHPIPDFLKKHSNQTPETQTVNVTPKGKNKLEEYIHTLPSVHTASILDQQESSRIRKIDKLLSFSEESSSPSTSPIKKQIQTPVDSSPVIPAQETTTFLSNSKKILESKSLSENKISVPISKPLPSSILRKSSPIQTEKKQISFSPSPKVSSSFSFVQPTFSNQLPISAPKIPNIIVGMITDRQGKIVDNAIIEIKDQYYKPVRALKSNKLGQFAIATSLKSGNYILQIEKDNLKFDDIKFQAEGKTIDPLSIVAK